MIRAEAKPVPTAGERRASRLKRVAWFYCELMQSGGGERLALEGSRAFESKGIENHVLVYTPYDRLAAFEGRYEPRVTSKDDPRFHSGPNGPLAILGQVLWLRRRLLELRPDIVVTEGTWVQVVHVYLATLGTGIPYAAMVAGSLFAYPAEHERTKYARVFRERLREIRDSVRGYRDTTPLEPPSLPPAKRLYNEAFSALKLLAVRGARRLFTHSRQNSWEVERLYGRRALPLKGAFPSATLSRAAGEDLRRRLGLEGRPVLLTLSRHSSNKRLDLCLRAFAELKRELPGAALLVAGKAYEHDQFRVERSGLAALAEELGVARDVRFLGYVPEAKLQDTLASCDAFVHLDLADFDIAPYEALAAGRKVVWSSEMELEPELARLGRVWPAEPTVEGAAKAMRAALASPARPLDDADRRVLSRYTWEEFFASMLAELEAGLPDSPSEGRHPCAKRPESPLGRGGAPPRQVAAA